VRTCEAPMGRDSSRFAVIVLPLFASCLGMSGADTSTQVRPTPRQHDYDEMVPVARSEASEYDDLSGTWSALLAAVDEAQCPGKLERNVAAGESCQVAPPLTVCESGQLGKNGAVTKGLILRRGPTLAKDVGSALGLAVPDTRIVIHTADSFDRALEAMGVEEPVAAFTQRTEVHMRESDAHNAGLTFRHELVHAILSGPCLPRYFEEALARHVADDCIRPATLTLVQARKVPHTRAHLEDVALLRLRAQLDAGVDLRLAVRTALECAAATGCSPWDSLQAAGDGYTTNMLEPIVADFGGPHVLATLDSNQCKKTIWQDPWLSGGPTPQVSMLRCRVEGAMLPPVPRWLVQKRDAYVAEHGLHSERQEQQSGDQAPDPSERSPHASSSRRPLVTCDVPPGAGQTCDRE